MRDAPVVLGGGEGGDPAAPAAGRRIPDRAARRIVLLAGAALAGLAATAGWLGLSDAGTSVAPAAEASLPAPDAGLLPVGFGGEVVLVTTDGRASRLETLGRSGWGAPVELPLLDWARFDVSGSFLAGTAGPGSGLGELWAGTPGEDLERIAAGVRAFAWHDTEPGRLAWTEMTDAGRLALTTARLPGGSNSSQVAAFHLGELRRWGGWGFAFLLPDRPLRTLLLDPGGSAIAEVDGYPVGEVAPGLPGLTADGGAGSDGSGGTYGYRDGRVEVEWVPDGEFVRAVEPHADGNTRAIVASDSGLRDAGQALVVGSAGEVVPWGAPSTGPAPLAWDVSGRYALAGSTGPRGQATIDIIDTVTGRRSSVTAGPRVILDMAVRSPPP
jgi:hypothetical protein